MHDIRTNRHTDNISRIRTSLNSFGKNSDWHSFVNNIPKESIHELDYTSEQLDRYYGRPQVNRHLWNDLVKKASSLSASAKEMNDEEDAAVNHVKAVFTETEQNRPVFGEHAIRVGQSRMNTVYGFFSQEGKTQGVDAIWSFIKTFNQLMAFVRNAGHLG